LASRCDADNPINSLISATHQRSEAMPRFRFLFVAGSQQHKTIRIFRKDMKCRT
jgi:hypothetical protein